MPCPYFRTMFSVAVNEARLKSARYERNFPLRYNLGVPIGWFLLEGDVHSYLTCDRKNEMPSESAGIIAGGSRALCLSLLLRARNKLNYNFTTARRHRVSPCGFEIALSGEIAPVDSCPSSGRSPISLAHYCSTSARRRDTPGYRFWNIVIFYQCQSKIDYPLDLRSRRTSSRFFPPFLIS